MLLWLFGISLAIQAGFFAFAATLRTDKVTDLSYGLTFVVIAVWLVASHATAGLPGWVLAGMVVLWGLRLAGYLLYRIITIKRDPRFDGIREHFWKFFQFWLFQGLAVAVIMLPVALWFDRPGPWHGLMWVGLTVWAAGLWIETVADAQKFRQKTSGAPDRWMSTGLWRYSRHPNYFGELLCWWGVFLYVAPHLAGWRWVAVCGPIAITYILLFATGIPTLEKSAARKWGNDPAYAAYVRRTSRLIPRPPLT